jgi:lipopolysaccharide/colanic/teichoic acid biosynthesis glycosyltransferase
LLGKGGAKQLQMKDITKRAFDITVCLFVLPIALPLLAVCAILIKLDSSGPVLFRQERLGRGKRPFRVVKLRTMVPNAEKLGAGLYTAENDPRFTRIGLFLRRFSLDELPQIFNVLAGSMSIVGPRPLPAVIVDEYSKQFDVILKVKPGITGLSQVSGRNELARSEQLKLDMFYAENWSFSLDLQMLLRTVRVVLAGAGQLNYRRREDVEQ